ncbi:MAG: sensor histidine kinase, partial [Deferrisomatales bacterium]
MRVFGRIVNPLVAFVGIQVAWILVVVFWVYSFIGSHRRLRALAEQYSPELLHRGADWFILVEGLVLLVLILVGVYVIFVYWSRQVALYRDQRNFVSQVTHELKSPLASIQLHLETVRLRHPPPEQLDAFVDTMLADVDRLHGTVTNLLSASRFEQKGPSLALRRRNLSQLVERFFRGREGFLPQGGRLSVDVEPDLWAYADAESLEIALRNLLENAVLYSDGPPEIGVRLRRRGARAHLEVSDRGRGVEPGDRKKVFRMFYRARRPGDRVPGSGLGLFIVRTVVLRHRG